MNCYLTGSQRVRAKPCLGRHYPAAVQWILRPLSDGVGRWGRKGHCLRAAGTHVSTRQALFHEVSWLILFCVI